MEDFMTTKYLQDVAAQAGLDTSFLYIEEVGVNDDDRFVDSAGNLIKNIYKLYPYEWMFDEAFGKYLITNRDNCLWVEPPYKAILSNKMLLKYLADMFPGSPYILPCTYLKPGETGQLPRRYAKKPIFSREGENVSLVLDGKLLEENGGEYGEEGYVYQEYFELPEFDGRHPIIGSWVIGGEPAGMGIRESEGRITKVTSSFCSHYIKPE
jgi:glutathionylspermidine synthase